MSWDMLMKTLLNDSISQCICLGEVRGPGNQPNCKGPEGYRGGGISKSAYESGQHPNSLDQTPNETHHEPETQR